VQLVKTIVVSLLYFFTLLLIIRAIMGFVLSLTSYRPSGFAVVVLELTYTVTDPPLRLLRRIIPPLQVGNVQLDLGFLLLFIIVQVLIDVVQRRL
jgi:YggT family protein